MSEEQLKPAVFGRNAVAELLKSGTAVDTIFLSETLDARTARYYTSLGKECGAVIKRVPTEKLNTLANGERHQGIAAHAAEVEYKSLEDILNVAKERGEDAFLLLCDGVEDPHNLGALLRSALLCGAHGVVIPKRGAAGVTPVVLKTSAGAAASLPIARVTNLGEAIRTLKKKNVFVWCADIDGTPLQKQDLSGPIALVVGNEGKGIGPLIRKLCDGAVCLPMAASGTIDSFNVSVAGGILLYEVFRRRHV